MQVANRAACTVRKSNLFVGLRVIVIIFLLNFEEFCKKYAIDYDYLAQFFSEDEIPWDEISFTTVKTTLEHYFADWRADRFSLHSYSLSC